MAPIDPRIATKSFCEVIAAPVPGGDVVLSAPALQFLTELAREFRPTIAALLAGRIERRLARTRGARFDFAVETRAIRAGSWRVAPAPADLRRRIVEITGPVDAKTVINAMNSGADVFMADFEDATSPTFDNLVRGQANLAAAVRGAIEHDDAETGKHYRLNARTAVLMARPRGLHLPERHVLVDGEPIPGALFDAGLFLFHCARTLLDRGSGPYLYLPKLESRHEARLWSDVLTFVEDRLRLPFGSIRVTVLIETLPAAFEMDEILFALRERAVGLNCGRWDYIFSFIKEHAHDPLAVLPDRGQVTMEKPFLRAYAQLLVRTCHRRGAHAIGGMSACIPNKQDPVANAAALARVRADKVREVTDGHDGTWVAHPGLVAVARAEFESRMRGDNQIHVPRAEVQVDASDLLRVPTGPRTVEGLRHNVRVGLRYLAAWLSGTGCVPLYGLMEDAATAEISRAQIWQWIRHGARLDGGAPLTGERVAAIVAEEAAALAPNPDDAPHFSAARATFDRLCGERDLAEFLTLEAYGQLHDAGT